MSSLSHGMVPIILMLIVSIALFALFIYLIVLLVRALRKYLRSGTDSENSPEQAKSLGEAIKTYRTGRGFTQEYVAEALGVSRQAVSKWENGTSEPSTANLLALAKLFGVSVEELLAG